MCTLDFPIRTKIIYMTLDRQEVPITCAHLCFRNSLIRPGDSLHADILVKPQGIPHRRRRVDDVVGTRGLVVVVFVAAIDGVALVHHLGIHGLAIGGDLDAVPATGHVLEPAGGERNDHLLIAVVGIVTLGRTAAVLALLKAVERQDGLGGRGDRRRAVVLRVPLAILATVRVVALLTVARLSWKVATCTADTETRAE